MPQYPQPQPPANYVRQSALLRTSTVGATSVEIIPAGACKRVLVIGNPSEFNLWINPAGEDAVVGQSALCLPQSEYIFDPSPTASVHAIAEGGSITIYANGC